MNGPSNSPRSPKAEPARKGIVSGTVLCAALLIGALLVFKLLKHSPRPEQPPPVASAPELKTRPISKPPPAPRDFPPVATPAPAPPVETAAVQPQPRSARQLMDELVELSRGHGPITKEQAEKFKENLAELVRQGAASVPAIQEFLDKNLDSYYANLDGGDQLGYSSLRASLFDTLKQIGGPEAQSAMLHVLQTTAMPSEVLALANDLEQDAPGQYRDQILKAAHEALDMASANQLGTNVEVGPIFHVLQAYGDANTVADVAKSNPENFYNAIAMANLPDGQGLPALIQMAQNSGGGSQTIATEMIAQLAGQNSQALDTLMQMAQNGQIPNNVWTRLAPILGGDQYQISSRGDNSASGNQGYSIVNTATTPDEINIRINTIQSILDALPDGSAPSKALQNELNVLNGKLSK